MKIIFKGLLINSRIHHCQLILNLWIRRAAREDSFNFLDISNSTDKLTIMCPCLIIVRINPNVDIISLVLFFLLFWLSYWYAFLHRALIRIKFCSFKINWKNAGKIWMYQNRMRGLKINKWKIICFLKMKMIYWRIFLKIKWLSVNYSNRFKLKESNS